MSTIQSLLSTHSGHIYVYCTSEEIARRFLRDAEHEGFTFGDGVKPTQRSPHDIYTINRDKTISAVGFVGHMAFHYANTVGGEPIIRVDYGKLIADNLQD